VSLTRGSGLCEVLDDIKAQVDQITIFPDGAESPRITEIEADELAIEFALSGDPPHHVGKAWRGRRAEYPGVTISLGGAQEKQVRFGPALAGNVALALFAIHAVLARAFRSCTRPVILLLVLLFAFAGAVAG